MLDACDSVQNWVGSLAGSALVSLRAKGYADIRDTYRLFPISLAKWTGLKESLDLPCDCENGCGGFCSIRARGMNPALYHRMVEYCEQDCRALLHAYQRDVARLESVGFDIRNARGDVRRTLGSVAWFTASKMGGVDQEPLSFPEYSSGLAAYYGGRTEVFRKIADSGYRYDVNSMYPWALLSPVPVGASKEFDGAQARRAFREGYPGAYDATLQIPECRFAPVPHRHDDSLVWAHGTVTGTWTGIELQAALDRGASIVNLPRAVCYPSEEPVYRPYVEQYYQQRFDAKCAGDDSWAAILKLALNSLTGKLAQKTEVCTLKVRPDNPLDFIAGDENEKRKRTGWIGGDAFVQIHHKVSPCARPIHAATLTSRARVKLLERLERAGSDAIYCDTDSVYTISIDSADVGDALGQWGLEGTLSDWLAPGPKMYRYIGEDGPMARAKGVPRATFEDVDRLVAGEQIQKTVGVEGVRSAFRSVDRAFVARTIKRQLRSTPLVAGTRWVEHDGSTSSVERSPNGSYWWGPINAGEHVKRLRGNVQTRKVT